MEEDKETYFLVREGFAFGLIRSIGPSFFVSSIKVGFSSKIKTVGFVLGFLS